MPPPVPTPITRINSFTTWQTDHPNQPLPGDWVDEDVDQSNDGINLLQERLAEIQRDDGQLLNEIVTLDSLAPEVLAALEDAQNTATAAAIAAAADAADAATDAANSAASAAQSAADAAASEQFATNAAAYEQGAITAQTAAEAAAAAAAGSAAQMPPPPLTAGKGLIVNPGATAYVLQDVMTDTGDGKWNGAGKAIKSIADAVAPTDATNLAQVQGLISGAGAVPPPVAGDVDKVLTATGANAFNWFAMTLAKISDMTAFMRAFNAIGTAAAALAALGGVPTTRQIIAGTGLSGGGDLSADRTIDLENTAVTPGAYIHANIAVDAQGRITAANDGNVREVPDVDISDPGKFLKATAVAVYDWAAFLVADLSNATAYMKGLLTDMDDAAELRTNIGAVPTTRTITVTAPITGGGSLAADRGIGHAASGVVAGNYTNPAISVDATGHVTAAANGAATLPTNYLTGLRVENGADAVNDINVNTGKCRSDADDMDLTVAAQIVKQLDAVFAEYVTPGTPTGMRMSTDAAPGASPSWWHVYLIGGSGKNTQPFAHNSGSAFAYPSGFTSKRLIFSLWWSGTTIRAFVHRGDWVQWKTGLLDINVTNLGAARTLYALTVPPGRVVEVIFNAVPDAASHQQYLCSPEVDDLAPGNPGTVLYTLAASSGFWVGQEGSAIIHTNTAQQIAARSSIANTILRFATLAYRDTRGRDG